MALSNNVFVSNKNNSFNVTKVFKDEGFDSNDVKLFAMISELHWDFGDNLKHEHGASDYLKKCRKVYNKLKVTHSFTDTVNILIAVSAADVASSQPFTDFDYFKKMMNKGLRKNRSSTYLPYIHNVPRIWPGRKAFEDFKFKTDGLKLRKEIMKIL